MATKTASVGPMDFKKGEKQQYAYDYIKDRIIKNVYKPQQLLSETELSAQMGGISRTPIRDALRCLTYEGLVESMPGRGVFVSDLRFEDILEIFEIRICLHTNAVRTFTERATDAEIAELKTVMQRHRECYERADYISAVETDHSFHMTVVKGTRNSRLYSLCQNYIDLTARASYFTTYDPERVTRSVEEHQAIYDAISSRDAERAVQLEREHFEGLSKYLAYAQISKFSPYSPKNADFRQRQV